MEKKSIGNRLNDIVFKIARYTELVVSIIIVIVVAILIVDLIHSIIQIPLFDVGRDYFMEFLSSALSLVVGVEFVKMLCKHTPETLIEVLMFATARQMVVEHLSTWQTLLGVLSIGALFAIRKYLFLKPCDEERKEDKF